MHDHDDEISNPSDNRHFADIINSRASRRGFIVGSVGAAALTFVGAEAHAGPHNPNKGPGNNSGHGNGRGRADLVGFTSIPLDGGPMPTIAPEYAYQVIIPWREKLDGSGQSYPYQGFTAEQQEKSIGIGHDGMW